MDLVYRWPVFGRFEQTQIAGWQRWMTDDPNWRQILGLKPPGYNAASNACVSASRWPEALALLKNAALGHLDLDRISYTTAINAYERGDKWQEAIALLASFPGEADAILFNAAINACADQWQEMRAAAKPNATGSDPSQHNHLRRHHQCLQKQQRVERSSAYSRFHAKVPRWNQRHCVQCSHQCVWKGRILASCTPNLGHDGEGCWDGLTSQMLTKSWLKVTRFWPRPTIMYRSWLFNIVHCFLSLAHHFEFYSLGVSAESPDISRRRRSKLTLPAMTRWLQPPPAVDAESRSDHGLTEGSMMFYRVWTLTQSMWLCVCVKTLVQLFSSYFLWFSLYNIF